MVHFTLYMDCSVDPYIYAEYLQEWYVLQFSLFFIIHKHSQFSLFGMTKWSLVVIWDL